MPLEGTLLAGKYRLEKLLAEGGMGKVYQAEHVRLHRKVAVKVMHARFLPYQDRISRFLNEAVGIADIRHRNIIEVFDVGSADTGEPFMVMDLLRGQTLKELLDDQGKLDPAPAAGIMVQVLAGLAVLHDRRILHRDIKPSNIFLSLEEDGTTQVKLLDFGVSKFHFLDWSTDVDMTKSESIIGTPSFMSPEVARGKKAEIDHRSDLFSCGVVLYRAVAGFNPFSGDNYNETIVNIIAGDAPLPSSYVPSLPADFDAIVLKSIRPAKEDRYQDCRAFAADLMRFLRRGEPETRPLDIDVVVEGEETVLSLGGQSAGFESSRAASGRKRIGLRTAALLVLAALAAVAALYYFSLPPFDWSADTPSSTSMKSQGSAGPLPDGSAVNDEPVAEEGREAGEDDLEENLADAFDAASDEDQPVGLKPEKSSPSKSDKEKGVKVKYFLKDFPE